MLCPFLFLFSELKLNLSCKLGREQGKLYIDEEEIVCKKVSLKMIFSLYNILLDHLKLLDTARNNLTFNLYIAHANQSCFWGSEGTYIQSMF